MRFRLSFVAFLALSMLLALPALSAAAPGKGKGKPVDGARSLGDPLLPQDPIYNCTADERARQRLVSSFDWATTIPEHGLGYRFDIVLAGREATPFER